MTDTGATIETRTGSQYDLVTVSGELDLRSHDRLRGLTGSTDLQAPLLVLDLTELTFLDSAGVGAIALAMRQCSDRGAELVLVASTAPVERVLSISGLDAAVRTVRSRAELGDLGHLDGTPGHVTGPDRG